MYLKHYRVFLSDFTTFNLYHTSVNIKIIKKQNKQKQSAKLKIK